MRSYPHWGEPATWAVSRFGLILTRSPATIQWGSWPTHPYYLNLKALYCRKLFLVSLCLLEPQTFSLCNLSQDNFRLPLHWHLLVPCSFLWAQDEGHALSYSASVFPKRSLGLYHFLQTLCFRCCVSTETEPNSSTNFSATMTAFEKVWLHSRYGTES